MDINTVYQKERHDFGRPVNGFGPSEVIVLDEFLPDDIAKGNNIEQNPTHLDIQAVATLSESYVNTETVVYKPQGMLHLEGGWPKEVDQTEKEHTARYKKKVEKDEDYLRQVRQMVDDMEGDLRQNYSLDIYQVHAHAPHHRPARCTRVLLPSPRPRSSPAPPLTRLERRGCRNGAVTPSEDCVLLAVGHDDGHALEVRGVRGHEQRLGRSQPSSNVRTASARPRGAAVRADCRLDGGRIGRERLDGARIVVERHDRHLRPVHCDVDLGRKLRREGAQARCGRGH